MEHKFIQEKGQLVVKMPQELDHHAAGRLRAETDYLIAKYPVRCIVFDFRSTVFMDSSGIGVILGRCRNMSFHGGKVHAVNLNQQVQKIFRVSGLHKIVEVEL